MKASHALPKARLPLWATLAAMVALSGCITLLALWCQPNALRTVVDIFRATTRCAPLWISSVPSLF